MGDHKGVFLLLRQALLEMTTSTVCVPSCGSAHQGVLRFMSKNKLALAGLLGDNCLGRMRINL
jgi:hypothetical protein